MIIPRQAAAQYNILLKTTPGRSFDSWKGTCPDSWRLEHKGPAIMEHMPSLTDKVCEKMAENSALSTNPRASPL
jgi:hypothetical protein